MRLYGQGWIWIAVVVSAASSFAANAHAAPANAVSTVDAQRQARTLDRDADRARSQDAARDVVRLRAQLVAMGQAEASGERTVGGARGQLRRLNLQEAELRVGMGRNKDSLTRLLGALQMYQRHPPPPLLVDPRSARDAVLAATLIQAITPELERRAQAFAAQSEALKRVRRRAAETSGVLFQAESDVADRQARIEDLIEQKRGLERQLDTDAEVADQDARRLAAKARSLGELVGSLDTHDPTSDAGAEDATPAQPFTAPVQGVLARRFGEAGADRLRGKGWTWTTDPGAPVLSPAAGRVDYAGPLKGWGLVVILRIGDDHLVLVGLASLGVDTGSTVAAGEPVGRMPALTAGSQTRPQLYLEIRRRGSPVDPAKWFAVAPAGSEMAPTPGAGGSPPVTTDMNGHG